MLQLTWPHWPEQNLVYSCSTALAKKQFQSCQRLKGGFHLHLFDREILRIAVLNIGVCQIQSYKSLIFCCILPQRGQPQSRQWRPTKANDGQRRPLWDNPQATLRQPSVNPSSCQPFLLSTLPLVNPSSCQPYLRSTHSNSQSSWNGSHCSFLFSLVSTSSILEWLL